MKKSFALAVLSSAVLAGCGGGGGGSSAPVYTWQIAQVTVKDSVSKNCVVYGTTDEGKLITAERSMGAFNILFHDASGAVLPEHTIRHTDLKSDLKVSIDTALVPTGGYVSLEEYTQSASNKQEIYLFSVEKSLLSNKQVNLRLPNQSHGCVTGSDYRDQVDSNSNAALAVYVDDSSVEYYQSSYTEENVTGSTNAGIIPVDAPLKPAHDVLVTAYYDYQNNQASDLAGYVFAKASTVFDKTKIPANRNPSTINFDGADLGNWNAESNLTLSSDSAILVHRNGHNYLWQHLHGTEGAYTWFPSARDIENWTAVFSARAKDSGWQLNSYMPIKDSHMQLSAPDSLMAFTHVRVDDACAIEGTSARAEFCIDNGDAFDADEMQVQRVFYKGKNLNNDMPMMQTIIAKPKAYQPLMQTSLNVGIDAALNAEALEISLLHKTDGRSASRSEIDFFMSQFMDLNQVNATYDYANGVISNADEKQTWLNVVMDKGAVILHQAK